MSTVKITKIKFNPNNPRVIKDDKFHKLVTSIKEFPQMMELRPIILDENNMVLGGNMRLRACKDIGIKDVHIQIFTREHAKQANVSSGLNKTYKEYCDEFIIKDNASFGDWDWVMLATEWSVDKLDNWGVGNYEMFSDGEKPLDEDWASVFEQKNDTSEHDGKQQITFVLPLEYLDKLKEWLKGKDKNKEIALMNIIDEFYS